MNELNEAAILAALRRDIKEAIWGCALSYPRVEAISAALERAESALKGAGKPPLDTPVNATLRRMADALDAIAGTLNALWDAREGRDNENGKERKGNGQ